MEPTGPVKHSRRDFVRILFVASQAAVAGRFLPTPLLAESAPPPRRPGELNFIVFGDWGRQGEADQVRVATQMAKTAQIINAKFIISVGDNFYENGVTSTGDRQWHTSFEDVYNAMALQVPWQVILGNHDYHGNCEAQIAYSQWSRRWKMPARYYVQSWQLDATTTVDFFFLDTTPLIRSYYVENDTRAQVVTQDTRKQLDWFRTALAASKAQWKIVIGHHPIYSGGEHGDTPELIENVLPLLHEHKVQAYFNGHDHDLQHLLAGEVNLFDSGAGSQVRPTRKTRHTRFASSCSGFTTVALRPDSMDVRMIDDRGVQIYSTSVSCTSGVGDRSPA